MYDMMNGGMWWGMGPSGVAGCVVVALGIVALCLFFYRRG